MTENITCVYMCVCVCVWVCVFVLCVCVYGVQMSFWDPFFSRFIAQTIVCVLWIGVPVSRLEGIRGIKRKRETRNKENE